MGDADAILSHGEKTVILDNESRGPHWSAEPTFGQTANAVHIGDIGAHILNALRTEAVQSAGGHSMLLGGQGNIRSDIRDSAKDVSSDVAGGQREILGAICDARDAARQESGKLSKDICDTRDATRQEGSSTRDRIQVEGRFNSEAFGTIRRELAGTESVLRKDLCDTRDAVRTEGSLIREVVKDQVNTARMEALREFGLVQLKAAENTAAIQLEQTKNAAAAALAAATNTAALRAAIDECCCDLKELVRGEGGQTRELLNATTLQTVRDQLSDAKNQNSLLQFLASKGNGNGPGNS